ncbi:MAG: sugar phosphate isomerase/epimerase [Armatimonadetes bacterium]|nr:sugar phosphate isomerase/epimerase [Armatimonadota bacterium]
MSEIRIGCVPITWGKWRRENPDEWPEERVLREVADAGYEGVSSGPKPGQSPREVIDNLAALGLKPAPGYLGAGFWKPEELPEIREKAQRMAAFNREAGLTELFVAASGFDYVSRENGKSRRELAGHVGDGDGLTEDEYQRFADALNEIGGILLEQGTRACFHNHVGTVIETREEVDRLFALVDPERVFMGPDTGHLAWAGADVTQFFRDYADRIKTAHLKDINAAVRDRGRDEEWDYGASTGAGVFVELGEGCVDFPELFRILENAGFSGWLLAETDVTQKPSAFESAKVSREYLKRIGY